MKKFLLRWVTVTSFLSLFLFMGCQKDENTDPEHQVQIVTGESTQKIVSAKDIPHVMEFIKKEKQLIAWL